MPDPAARALGRKIAFYRTRRGLSQRDFAALVNRSETWLSQVERGVRRIDRMTVLRRVADALGVALSELAADTPVIAAATMAPESAVELRMLLSSSLALALAVETPPDGIDLGELSSDAERASDMAHAAKYEELLPLLSRLIPHAEAAVRSGLPMRQRRFANTILARIYHACAAALAKLGDVDAAWIAADRAISAAERAEDHLLMGASAFRLVLVFQSDRRYQQVEQTARTAIAALAPLAIGRQPAAVSLCGVLRLQLAVAAARRNDHELAYAELGEAEALAAILEADRNDYGTEFGPTNVRLHEVAVAVELGDAGKALRAADGIDLHGMSAERSARLLIDVARAQMQRRNVGAVLQALMDAEKLTPEQVHKHHQVRNLLHDLIRSGHGGDPRFRKLAKKCGIAVR